MVEEGIKKEVVKDLICLVGPSDSQRQGTLAEVVQQSIIEEVISPMRIMLEAQEAERRRCCLDGDQCPYGHPNGIFTERPKSFCKYGACSKIEWESVVVPLSDGLANRSS